MPSRSSPPGATREELRERYYVGAEAVGGMLVLATCTIVAVLWGASSHRGLLVWAGSVISSAILYQFLKRKGPRDFAAWFRAAMAAEVWLGVAWGGLVLWAMPDSPLLRVLLLSLYTAAMLTSTMNSAHFAALNVAFTASIAVTASVGYAINGGDIRFYAFLVLGSGFLVCLTLIKNTQQLHAKITAEANRSAELAAGLAAERTQLERSNLRLETANRQLDELSRHDLLTALPNRLAFEEYVERLSAGPTKQQCLSFLDIDNFKGINDSFGHSAGDAVLRQLAARLTAWAGKDDFVARLGGDEVVVIATQPSPTELGQALRSIFHAPFDLGGRSVPVSGSIGVAQFTTSESVEDVLRHADTALYRAKEMPGASFVVFDEAVRSQMHQLRAAEREIASAITAGEIVPYVQPVVSFSTGRVVGGEALARWQHPTGLRTAESFIGVAKNMGLFRLITERTLDDISDLLTSLDESGHAAMPIAVNVSPAHIDGLVDSGRLALAHRLIDIEITEDQQVRDLGQLGGLLTHARTVGLRVALDELGMGYTSFVQLLRLPADSIKVDRSFVAEMTSCETTAAVVASLVDMARRLGMNIVAEGIETVGQMEALRALGIDRGQGYLFSPAVPIAAFAELIKTDARFPAVGTTTFAAGS